MYMTRDAQYRWANTILIDEMKEMDRIKVKGKRDEKSDCVFVMWRIRNYIYYRNIRILANVVPELFSFYRGNCAAEKIQSEYRRIEKKKRLEIKYEIRAEERFSVMELYIIHIIIIRVTRRRFHGSHNFTERRLRRWEKWKAVITERGRKYSVRQLFVQIGLGKSEPPVAFIVVINVLQNFGYRSVYRQMSLYYSNLGKTTIL